VITLILCSRHLLVSALLELESFSSVISRSDLNPPNLYIEKYLIGNSATEQAIEWYVGDGVFISIPDPSARLSYDEADFYCRSTCPSCVFTNSFSLGLVALKTDINIALFHYLTKKVYNESGYLNYQFWTSLKQQTPNYLEPDEGFYFSSPDFGWEDRFDMKLWRPGQPDNFDGDTFEINVNCACYDARTPDGLSDCACTSRRIPVCVMLGKIYRTIFCKFQYFL
jgi:hypothetical protein